MNTMEQHSQPNEVGIKEEGMDTIVKQLQTLENALKQFKMDQDVLRGLPERGEKNKLLAEIEEKIRTTSAMIIELQAQKMELLQKADAKYTVPVERQVRDEGPIDDSDFDTIRLIRARTDSAGNPLQ